MCNNKVLLHSPHLHKTANTPHATMGVKKEQKLSLSSRRN